MQEVKKQGNVLTSFPRTFWIANLMELFERGAYYGMNAVLAIYLVKELEFSASSFKLIKSELTPEGPVYDDVAEFALKPQEK